MQIALDYDHTYTADPRFWDLFIKSAQRAGHDVRIVTVRNPSFDMTPRLDRLRHEVPIIWTSGVAKRWHCLHFGEGFVPDIWIDDKPESILQNSTTSPEALAEWRLTRPEEP